MGGEGLRARQKDARCTGALPLPVRPLRQPVPLFFSSWWAERAQTTPRRIQMRGCGPRSGRAGRLSKARACGGAGPPLALLLSAALRTCALPTTSLALRVVGEVGASGSLTHALTARGEGEYGGGARARAQKIRGVASQKKSLSHTAEARNPSPLPLPLSSPSPTPNNHGARLPRRLSPAAPGGGRPSGWGVCVSVRGRRRGDRRPQPRRPGGCVRCVTDPQAALCERNGAGCPRPDPPVRPFQAPLPSTRNLAGRPARRMGVIGGRDAASSPGRAHGTPWASAENSPTLIEKNANTTPSRAPPRPSPPAHPLPQACPRPAWPPCVPRWAVPAPSRWRPCSRATSEC